MHSRYFLSPRRTRNASVYQTGLQEGCAHTMNLGQLLSTVHSNNEDQAINDIHNTLKAYYKVALQHFMNNVVNAVVETHLLENSRSVQFLGRAFISSLGEEELAAISRNPEGFVTNCREACRRLQTFGDTLAVVRSLSLS